MNEPNYSRETEQVQAELVAYLDGELDHAAAQHVERRLSEDPAYRRRLQQLQRTWDLLDQLPRVEASETFATTTVEMVAMTASEDGDRTAVSARRRKLGLWVLQSLSLAAAAAIGFVLVQSQQQRPERRFLRDLPIIENVDLYLSAGEIDFVRQLDSEKLFEQEPPNVSAWTPPRR